MSTEEHLNINIVVVREHGLRVAFTLAALDERARSASNEDGWFPATARALAEQTGTTETTVRRSLARLLQLGYIERAPLSGLDRTLSYRFAADLPDGIRPTDEDVERLNAQASKLGVRTITIEDDE